MVDPLKYGLLFERFMSPSRAEMPDIDSDVEIREEALDILKEHFGYDNVIAISNYNRLKLKSLIKDISRLYGVDFQRANEVTKVIEDEAKPFIMEEIGHDQKLYELTFEKALEYSKTFQKYLEDYPDIGLHITNLFKEVKSIGKHAGGTIVVPDAEGCLPIIKIRGVDQSPVPEGITAQHLKHLGLIKFDVLGIATLKIIRRCIEYILKEQGNKDPTIDDVWKFYDDNLHPDIIDFNDSKVYENVFQNGRFISTFQFAEKRMQSFCKKAKPTRLEDLTAITSIFRPGPLKAGANERYVHFLLSEIKKEHSIIQELLGDSRMVLCYQEQFMLLAHKLAGFSLDEADRLRKLLVKPATSLAEEMKKERIEIGEKFIQGCIDKGLTKERADRLWNKEILGFISYGFNKSLLFSEKVTIYNVVTDMLSENLEQWVVGQEDVSMETLFYNKMYQNWYVKSRDELTKEDVYINIQDVYDHGEIEVYEFSLDNGKKVRCSKDHKFRVKDGRMLPIWKIMAENLDIVA